MHKAVQDIGFLLSKLVQIPNIFQTFMVFGTSVFIMGVDFTTKGPVVTQSTIQQLVYVPCLVILAISL
jgi:hypothetical protein